VIYNLMQERLMKFRDKNMEMVLQTLVDNSNAMANYILNHPMEWERISHLALQDDLPPIHDAIDKIFKEQKLDIGDLQAVKRAIRISKYDLLAILTYKYLTNRLDTETFLRCWSEVADVIIDTACLAALRHTERENGIPITNTGEGFVYSVVAVGKLGAQELNLSSDVDLLFIYNTDDGFVKEGSLTLNEFASKVTYLLIQILQEKTEDGFCFRVDADLRPEGRMGVITNSVDALISFYTNFCTELDRVMLIRARPVGGDKRLGEEFIKAVHPLIFRRSFDVNSLSRIKELKERITKEALRSAEEGRDIKRGRGGIREAEFVVHAIQLTHGGKNSEITCKNTFEAIKAIRNHGLMPSRDAKDLLNAYTFLRRLENFIQLESEEQTHVVPSDKTKLNQLASRMGYKPNPSESLLSDIDAYTSIVENIFKRIFEEDPRKLELLEAISANISSCTNREEMVDSLCWFKNEETKKVAFLDMEKGATIKEISERLTLIAEAVLLEAYKMASKDMKERFGLPLSKKPGEAATLAIVGMGKLGGMELDYGSDLDLIFIYSEDGETSGPKAITNQEFFTRLAQRIISLLTLPTRYGKAYAVDTDLRPSGRSGVLVSSFDSFKHYHLVEGMTWERQALLKARVIEGERSLRGKIEGLLEELCYHTPLPKDIKEQIRDMREKVIQEAGVANGRVINIKTGAGGIADIETLVQYLQLKHGGREVSLRTPNTQEGLDAIEELGIIDEEEALMLKAAYEFLKKLLCRIRLLSGSPTNYLERDSELTTLVSKSLGYRCKDELVRETLKNLEEVTKIYQRYFGNYSANVFSALS